MELYSVYEVDCLCGEKLRTYGKTVTCEKCGREITLESWQIRHTLTADGLLVENSQVKKK
jgi:hypothetical protein